jgi:hypothetical protein
MSSCGLLRRVAIVGAEISEERIIIIRVEKISKLGSASAVTSHTASHPRRRHSSKNFVGFELHSNVICSEIGNYTELIWA